MADETTTPPPTEDVPLGMGNPGWVPVPDDEPAPRLPNGLFVDPDDGTPVWYPIQYRGPDGVYTARDLRTWRGDTAPPPIIGPYVPEGGDAPAFEFRGGHNEPEPVEEPVLNPDQPRNVTPDGTPHFLRILPDGKEVCGGCTELWPCGKVEPLQIERSPVAPDGRPAQVALDVDRLAIAQGADVNDLERVVEQLRRQEIERTGVDPFAGITRAQDEGRRYAE